jgi:hypothetical protein
MTDKEYQDAIAKIFNQADQDKDGRLAASEKSIFLEILMHAVGFT